MSDLCILASDGWTELELGSAYRNLGMLRGALDWDALWSAAGAGDDASVAAVLEEAGIWFAHADTDGERLFDGRIEFRIVELPDDMAGSIRRIWFRIPLRWPVEVWADAGRLAE